MSQGGYASQPFEGGDEPDLIYELHWSYLSTLDAVGVVFCPARGKVQVGPESTLIGAVIIRHNGKVMVVPRLALSGPQWGVCFRTAEVAFHRPEQLLHVQYDPVIGLYAPITDPHPSPAEATVLLGPMA